MYGISALLIDDRKNNPCFVGLFLLYWRKATPTLVGWRVSSSERYSSGTITFSQFSTKDSRNSRTAAAQSCWKRSSMVLISSNRVFEQRKQKRLIDIIALEILWPYLGEKTCCYTMKCQIEKSLNKPKLNLLPW